MISKTIDIVVTSVLQTTAGKMIFGRYVEPSAVAQSMPAAVVPAAVPAGAQTPSGVARTDQTPGDKTESGKPRLRQAISQT
jgi:hypothetical protein